MTPNKIIIDTDPGIDDINALLFALAADPDRIEVLLISATYGNVDVENCLRNVVTMFYIIEKERRWRQSQGLPRGFESLDRHKPIVAVGPRRPLEEQQTMADYFHGRDGLGGIYESHAHLFPTATAWEHLFDIPPPAPDIMKPAVEAINVSPTQTGLFVPSKNPSHLEILDVLSAHPPNTITIICLGPLTNLALAAAANPSALKRAREIVTMGGALSQPGNVTPLAEFNIYADSIAAARIFALTSPSPESTTPPKPPQSRGNETDGQQDRDVNPPLSDQEHSPLNLILFPLDITEKHPIFRSFYLQEINQLRERGSPLAEWHAAFMASAFRKMEKLHLGHSESSVNVTLHDPLCVWWALEISENDNLQKQDSEQDGAGNGWRLSPPLDIRIETVGQWSRGACVVDRRNRRRNTDSKTEAEEREEKTGDIDGWLSSKGGNRVRVCTETPGGDIFPSVLFGTIFASLRHSSAS